MVRNAAIAAGNSGSGALVEPLKRLVSDPDPVVADAAEWALSKLTGTHSTRAQSRAVCDASVPAPLAFSRHHRTYSLRYPLSLLSPSACPSLPQLPHHPPP